MPDTLDRMEDVDSMESRLAICSVGRLGGKAGHGWDEYRLGKGGGAGLGLSTPFPVSGGGGSFSAFLPFGRLPIVVFATEPLVHSGGLLTDLGLCTITGLFAGIWGFDRIEGESPGTRLI